MMINPILVSKDNKPFHTSNSVIGSRKLFNKNSCKCGNTSCGCKKSQGCTTVDLQETIKLLSRINYKTSTLSEKVRNNLTRKHPLTNEKEHLEKLLVLKKSISRHKNRLLRSVNLNKVSKSCISDKKVQKIFEQAKHLLGIGYSPEKSLHYILASNIPVLEDGLIIDSSNLNSWLVEYPYCAPIELWEKLAYRICGKLNIDIVVEEIKCNLTYDIIKESLPLEVLSGLSIGNITKRNNILNKRSSDECKLDWEILVEEQDCDIDYDVYISLVEQCNLTYDIVAEAYKCGLSFKLDNGQCILEGKNFSYNLTDINFGSPITSLETLEEDGIKFSTNTLERVKLEKLIADYQLNEKQLRKLK
jgi:hypothetical protein